MSIATWEFESPPLHIMFFDIIAEIAQLVEHNLAKVGVAGPSPVFRSFIPKLHKLFFIYNRKTNPFTNEFIS